MDKLIAFVGVVLLLALGSGGSPAFAQSTPPSAIFGPTTASPSKSPYLHIFSCYDASTGDLLNCQVSDQLAGLVPPLTDETNTGFHLKHTHPAPLTDGNAGAHGFECVACTDSNTGLLIVQTVTNSTVAVVLHQVPQFAGRLQVKVSIIPPFGWSCLTDCNFDFVEEIAVDGLSQIEDIGPNHQVIRDGRITHPLGTSATSETLNLARVFAWIYKLVTGNGISYNDFSLPYGGKFDLANGYAENDNHQGHRRGTQFDINSQDLGGKSIDCLSDQDLQFALAFINAARGSECHRNTGAYHVQF